MFLLLTLVIIVLIILLLICKCLVLPRCCNCFKKGCSFIMGKLMFNSLIRAAMQTFLMTSYSMWLSLKVTDTNAERGKINLTLAILLLVYSLLLPCWSYCYLRKKYTRMPSAQFKMKFDSLYQNLDYFKKRALPHTSWFLMRRLLFAAVIVFCQFSIVLQVFLADILSTLLLIFFITVKPMYDRTNNVIQIVNESVVLVSVWLMFHFTEFVTDPEDRYDLAFYFLYFVAVDVALNVALLVFTLLKKIFLSIKRCCLRRIAKGRAKEKISLQM